MKKRFMAAGIVSIVIALGFFGTASAQKLHAPKGIWKGMVASLSDVQDIVASLMVFNMERIAARASDIAGRSTYVSQIESLPDAVKEGHKKVAAAAEELEGAAMMGEEQDVTSAVAAVIAACNACHYDQRDAERREKME